MNAMNYSKTFLVKPGSKVKLYDIDTDFTGKHENKEAALKIIERNDLRLRELQELLYAEHKRSLLICLQAIDTGGKDGVISHVLGAMNPQGCRVAPFRQPTSLERDHDFLWRAHRDVPAIGEVTIFNRSHYEDVLTVRIHNLVPGAVWSKHYGQINDFEKSLCENGTHILKFFLHISKDEQLKRFKARLDDPTKHWKISESDYTERERWDDYVEAFDDMLTKCSTGHAPWFIIPANHKWFRDLAISQIMVDYLEGLKMKFPEPSVNIDQIRKKYYAAKKGK
jgi:PPK2 family polyphosphate:nucleotide phosphotransferase